MIWIKKALVWLKSWWWIPAGAIAVVVLYLIGRKTTARKVIDTITESAQKQKEAMEKIEEEKQDKEDKARELYDKAIKDLQEKHQKNLNELDEKMVKKVENYVKDFDRNPEKAARKFAEEFGLEYVE